MRGILISGATAFLISFLLTPAFIKFLSRKGYGQQIRDDGPKSHHIKRGTPTMGGVILILAAIAGYLLSHIYWSSADNFSGIGDCFDSLPWPDWIFR